MAEFVLSSEMRVGVRLTHNEVISNGRIENWPHNFFRIKKSDYYALTTANIQLLAFNSRWIIPRIWQTIDEAYDYLMELTFNQEINLISDFFLKTNAFDLVSNYPISLITEKVEPHGRLWALMTRDEIPKLETSLTMLRFPKYQCVSDFCKTYNLGRKTVEKWLKARGLDLTILDASQRVSILLELKSL